MHYCIKIDVGLQEPASPQPISLVKLVQLRHAVYLIACFCRIYSNNWAVLFSCIFELNIKY